jgi:hypothetical protein
MRYVIHLVGISIIGAAFYLLVNFVEKDFVLSEFVIPPPGVKLPQWLDSFKTWATLIVTASVGASFLWYVIFQWGIKVNNRLSASGKRAVWYLFLLIPLIVIVLGFIFTQQAQERGWIAYFFYILDGLFCYYVATALFSPLSFKYTPVWAVKLRRWW